MQDFNSFSMLFYYIIITTYQKIGDLFCLVLTNIYLQHTYIFIHLFSLSDNNSGGQRTAGDVLNDIGSMLADLTDELDAMLHMDPNQAAAAGGNGSAAAGFSKA